MQIGTVTERRQTRQIHVGDVAVGGGVSVGDGLGVGVTDVVLPLDERHVK